MSSRFSTPEEEPYNTPNAARMYDYFLGGYHNFAPDRQAAEAATRIYPDFPFVMRANRAFLRRSVEFLLAQGIDQFLDLGSGIPTAGNVHEVVQRRTPAAHVVYVDNDPIAVSQSAALLQDSATATIIQADARHSTSLLAHPEVQRLLDLTRPVAVLLLFFLHFIPEDAEAHRVVRGLHAALPSGSYLVISHATSEGMAPETAAQLQRLYAASSDPVQPRSRAQIAAFFEEWELIEPGLVYTPLWRPEEADDLLLDQPSRAVSFAGVGYKP